MCAAAALWSLGCKRQAPGPEQRATDELARVAQIEAAMPGIVDGADENPLDAFADP